MGTPLDIGQHGTKPDGRGFRSGTEWEFLDAVNGTETSLDGKPFILVFRCTRTAHPPDFDDPAFEEAMQQYNALKEFCAEYLRDPETGVFKRDFEEYEAPSEFEEKFEFAVKDLIEQIRATYEITLQPVTENASRWTGSPFPGLRAFTPDDAPIFFGRGRETDALLQRVRESRFVAVVGASGSGKSSLVGAGLTPRLRDNALPGSKDWRWLRFTPGQGANPVAALAETLGSTAPLTPDTLPGTVQGALAGRPDWAELLIFVDQFEELFTVVDEKLRAPFADLLAHAATLDRLRIVATLRADFYHRCVEIPALAALLEHGTYPLSVPGERALFEMITKPAERAGLRWQDERLPDRILSDTGREPGALALMAYTLDELYQGCRASNGDTLTHEAYDALGGVQGAIGTRAENTFTALDADTQAALPHIFRELVAVNEQGTATRQRAPLEHVTDTEREAALVRALTGARLLVQTRGDDNRPVVEVAHEALFRSWPRLAGWIETAQDDLRLLRQVRQAAVEWHANNRDRAFLWPDERLQPVYDMRERLQPDLDAVTLDFIRPEVERLVEELDDIDIPHTRRATIGERLAVIGDPRPGVGLRPDGLPDIAWCAVPGGEVTLTKRDRQGNENKLGTFTVEPFYIARYPVTYCQFQAFVDAEDGFQNDKWWEGLTEQYRKQNVQDQRYKFANHLRDIVSWYQAVAFCRWLAATQPPDGWPDLPDKEPAPGMAGRLLGRKTPRWEIRLPTEWEWFQAATGGDPANVYPWGKDWDRRRANASDAGLGRGAAAGLYPAGVSSVGVLDMVGGLWEWCLNEYRNPENIDYGGDSTRALRGGAYHSNADSARCGSRSEFNDPYFRNDFDGFRVCVARPPSL